MSFNLPDELSQAISYFNFKNPWINLNAYDFRVDHHTNPDGSKVLYFRSRAGKRPQIAPGVTLGKNAIIKDAVHIFSGAQIDNNVYINSGATIEKGVKIGVSVQVDCCLTIGKN